MRSDIHMGTLERVTFLLTAMTVFSVTAQQQCEADTSSTQICEVDCSGGQCVYPVPDDFNQQRRCDKTWYEEDGGVVAYPDATRLKPPFINATRTHLISQTFVEVSLGITCDGKKTEKYTVTYIYTEKTNSSSSPDPSDQSSLKKSNIVIISLTVVTAMCLLLIMVGVLCRRRALIQRRRDEEKGNVAETDKTSPTSSQNAPVELRPLNPAVTGAQN